MENEYIIPYLKNDNYDKGIKNGFSAVLEEVCKEYNIEVSGAETAESAQDIYSDTYGKFILLLFVSIILSTIIRASTEKNSKRNIIKLIYIISVGILSFIILVPLAVDSTTPIWGWRSVGKPG